MENELFTRKVVFRDAAKIAAQDSLKQQICAAIVTVDGAEIDDICYVLTELLVAWQLTLFKNLNTEAST